MPPYFLRNDEMSEQSEKKELYRIVRPWTGKDGQPTEVGAVIEGPIHPALLSNVQKVVGELVTGEAPKESEEIIKKAKAEAETIISDAKTEADGILADAKAEANRLLDEAQKDAETIINAAKPKR
jgi:cell division septum initiation protein DivIVA